MESNLLDFSKFETKDSKFNAELSQRGGYITFSNSGKGSEKKYFTLSLDSFLTCLIDIRNNITEFKGKETYIEKEWRDLGSKFYTDKSANAQSTVQTKPMFATLSKLIAWANSPNLDYLNFEQEINLDENKLDKAIDKINTLAVKFIPDLNKSTTPSPDVLNFKEKFADWFIKQEGGQNNNYFTQSFSSNRDKLIEKLGEYEDIYEAEFGAFVFNVPRESLSTFSQELEKNLYIDRGAFFEFSSKTSNHMPRAILGRNNYLKFLTQMKLKPQLLQTGFDFRSFCSKAMLAGLIFSEDIIVRFLSSLLTKPFVILTGLSGSGKTKLAHAFASWICEDESQFCIVPVGADWTNREPLLGFPNSLNPDEYVMPQNGALKLIIESQKEENNNKPYFLILDEMNLSHVERYFADFLSAMESKSNIDLHCNAKAEGVVPLKIDLPSNLFIIGTVNIDETTYMFSPKVLDRASVIEFRVSEKEMEAYLGTSSEVDMDIIKNQGAGMALDFVGMSSRKFLTLPIEDTATLRKELLEFFLELKKTGSEFGYRTASEILRFVAIVNNLDQDWSMEKIMDAAIMQKLLPKVHGSRKKLTPVLEKLGALCLNEGKQIKDVFENNGEPDYIAIAKFPISLEKIKRMYRNLMDNGFTSYAEA